MIKHILFAIYIFAVLYCYIQTEMMFERCISTFIEKHPKLQHLYDGASNAWLPRIKILSISLVPFLNIGLGFLISCLPDEFYDTVASRIEDDHRDEIFEWEADENEL